MLGKLFRYTGLFRVIKYLKSHNAAFAKWYQYMLLNRVAKTGEPWILVYSMGKVGSSTINKSLIKHSGHYQPFHCHWLNPENLRKDKHFHRKFYEKGREVNGEKIILPDYLIKGFYLAENLSPYLQENQKIKMITMTRDPLARNISSFFENLPLFFDYSVTENLKVKKPAQVVADLCNLFNEEFIGNNGKYFLDCDPLTWFDDELKRVFDLDVYESVFPVENGYSILKNEKAEVLIIRLEDLNQCYSRAISDFIDVEYTDLEPANIAENKAYANVYSIFKKEIKLSDDYLNKLYGSKYATHFYSEEEIRRFRERWS